MARTILLVDDDDDIRTVARLTLKRVAKWTVLQASSGEQALAVAAAELPDAILLDVMMPGMDGPTTLERLRAQAETAHIPIIFMTAKVQTQEVARYLELGAAGVIKKPFDPLLLGSRISELLSW